MVIENEGNADIADNDGDDDIEDGHNNKNNAVKH
jgi:hypothetical protein